MTDLLITMSSSGVFTLTPHAGRIEEYCAKRLKIKLNVDFLTSAIKYYTLSFEPFSLSRKIVTENIYRDSESTEGIHYADGHIFCPIYDYIAVSPTVAVQIDGYETDEDGNVTAIIKSGIFNLNFAQSLTGEGMMLQTVRPDVKFFENVSTAVDKALETKTIHGEQIEGYSITGREIALNTITTLHLQENSVNTKHLKEGAVKTEKLADGCVTNKKLTNASVTAEKIAENAVTTDKIADENVTAVKLADGAVTNVKLADYSVSEKKLCPKGVTTSALADGAVTPAKLDREYITHHQSLEGYATEDWVEKKGYLTSGEGFLKDEDLPTRLSEFENDVAVSFVSQQLTDEQKSIARENIGAVQKEEGKTLSHNDFTDKDKEKLDSALTEHQDISMKADVSSLSQVAFSGSYKDLTDQPEINEFTDILKEEYDKAYSHSVSEHAPITAQENVIESLTVNGEIAEIKEKNASICVIGFEEKEKVFVEVY